MKQMKISCSSDYNLTKRFSLWQILFDGKSVFFLYILVSFTQKMMVINITYLVAKKRNNAGTINKKKQKRKNMMHLILKAGSYPPRAIVDTKIDWVIDWLHTQKREKKYIMQKQVPLKENK